MADATQFINALLPTGLASAVYFGVKAIQLWRRGREQREDKVVNSWISLNRNLEKKNRALQADVIYKDTVVSYWRDRCQVREMTLASKNLLSYEDLNKYPTPPQPPPSIEQPTTRRNQNRQGDDDDDSGTSIKRLRRRNAG